MRVVNLGSGSKGNSTLIETETTKILLDCGFGQQELLLRLKLAKVEPEQINAIVITHEHADHIKGLRSFARKFKVDVFAFDKVMPILASHVDNKHEKAFSDKPFYIGDVLVTPFPVSHDSLNCQGFTFVKGQAKFGYATDLGFVSGQALANLLGSKLVFIEANHDEKMLANGPYPPILKARIRSNSGHLSNVQCAEAALSLASNGTKFFALCHLSEHNNTPELAYGTVANALIGHGFNLEKEVVLRLTYQFKIGNNFIIGEN